MYHRHPASEVTTVTLIEESHNPPVLEASLTNGLGLHSTRKRLSDKMIRCLPNLNITDLARGRPKPIYAHSAVTATMPKLRSQLRL